MCAIVGILANSNVSVDLYEALIHLQHRGQDAAGITTIDKRINTYKENGLVSNIFTKDILFKLEGSYGIGHTRYPTVGGGENKILQPCDISTKNYEISLAHNGNLTNHSDYYAYKSDSETIVAMLGEELEKQDQSKNFWDKLKIAVYSVLKEFKGSYSVVATITDYGLIGFRDPNGIRPLVLGKREEGDKTSYILASEPTMFPAQDFELERDVLPGELIYIDKSGNLLSKIINQKEFRPCVFEYVYFARTDSTLDDVNVYRARLRMGQNLAIKWRETFPNIIPDVVVPVPFTSNTAAASFSRSFGIRFCEALHKNSYINRTFIAKDQKTRSNMVKHKFTPLPIEIENRNVLLVDDSIVRGTTSKKIVSMVRKLNPKKIYFASACPPIKYPCHYGINIPTSKELIASSNKIEQIKEFLGVDELLYLGQDDLIEAIARRGEKRIDNPCMACMNGNYVNQN